MMMLPLLTTGADPDWNERSAMPGEQLFVEASSGVATSVFPSTGGEFRVGPSVLARIGLRSRVAELHGSAEYALYLGSTLLSVARFSVGVAVRYHRSRVSFGGSADIGAATARQGVLPLSGVHGRLAADLDVRVAPDLFLGPSLNTSVDVYFLDRLSQVAVGLGLSVRIVFLM